jgi:hypothetical protein
MIELQLSQFAKARVWLSELPPIAIHSTKILTRVFPSQSNRVEHTRRAGIELYVPAGGKTNYALLAGEFAPSESANLSIEMPVTDATGDLVTWALASNIDKVRAGLPEEYAAAVLSGMTDAANVLGSGMLTLGPAAHGEISSSPHIFSRAARALLSVLSAEPQALSNETISQILTGVI